VGWLDAASLRGDAGRAANVRDALNATLPSNQPEKRRIATFRRIVLN
jgi:hypothetical protein